MLYRQDTDSSRPVIPTFNVSVHNWVVFDYSREWRRHRASYLTPRRPALSRHSRAMNILHSKSHATRRPFRSYIPARNGASNVTYAAAKRTRLDPASSLSIRFARDDDSNLSTPSLQTPANTNTTVQLLSTALHLRHSTIRRFVYMH